MVPHGGPKILTGKEDTCVGLVILQELTLEEIFLQMEERTYPLE
jgi:hypothetical protein